MSGGYRQIVGAVDWYFVGQGVEEKPLAFPLAAWGLTQDGQIYGLVGDVPMGGDVGGAYTAHLIRPPPICGAYKHRCTMTAAELAAIPTPEKGS